MRFESPDDGWLIELDTHYQGCSIFYQQALQQFSKNNIKYTRLQSNLDDETSIGNWMDCITNRYASIQNIHLVEVWLSSFHAETTRQHLKMLAFGRCLIEPDVLPQLSSTVQTINEPHLDECTTPLSDDSFDDYI